MHAAALHVIRKAHRPILRRACRVVGGSRYPLSQRSFHRSAISYRTPDDQKGNEGDKEDANVPETAEDKAEADSKLEPEVEPEAIPTKTIYIPSSVDEDPYFVPRPKQGKGSGRVRGVLRSKAPEGVPPIVIPSWFWESNVKLAGKEDLTGTNRTLDFGGEGIPSIPPEGESATSDPRITESAEILPKESTETEKAKYSIHADIYKEILADVRAGLILKAPKGYNTQASKRPRTVLHCPKDGGALFLDAVVESVAAQCDADLIRLDSQDIAEIVGPYIDEEPIWSNAKISSYKTSRLAYQVHKFAGRLEEHDEEPRVEKEEVREEEEEDASNKQSFSFQLFSALPGMKPPPQLSPGRANAFNLLQAGNISSSPAPKEDQWSDLKLTTAFDALISSADAKRAASSIESETLEEAEMVPESTEKPIIVQIKDSKELLGTNDGRDLLTRLQTCVDKRWQEGRRIILVGTTDIQDQATPLMRSTIQHLQSDVHDGDTKTILVVPKRSTDVETTFETDDKARIRKVNIRHVEDMIVRLADGFRDLSPHIDLEKDVDSAVAYAAGIEDSVWSYARVHRIATTILGLEWESEAVDGVLLSQALKMLSSSDDAKFSWAVEEKKQDDSEAESVLNERMTDKKRARQRINKLRKRCNPQESKLLSGVVFPTDIRTTFADIRAPVETIEGLKTLTSLSLTRPEAFKYGVLATDKIPGLLLYGPPGTGKTLLAKAVAKESGATVLEITAADLNDMFVGQGEKNVRAVFSLAKKLSPCVVFIDEADAIFASRHEGMNRAAHREMINQFLREWDGLTTDTSAFIMVATNRPFDIDEAVLRRLPRRILVDLPVEKDREAILKLNLRDELLDETVSVEQLAKDTPFYSGSDIKNLVVAAALACIREENDLAAKYIGEEPFKFPEKRVLTQKHFDKAIEEISASISEDMSTLTAIRKFDEKYGDRKGRRKKGPGLGFGGTKVEEKDSEAVRVRKMGA